MSTPELELSYSDDPRVVKEAATEDYSLHAVPQSWRSSRGSLAMVWYALATAMFWLVLPATISLQVGTVDTLIGLGLSVVAFGAVNAFITRHAARSGLTTALYSRSMFGYAGAALSALILATYGIYFAAFEGSVIALAFSEYFGGLPLEIWYLIVVLYSVPLVFGGVRVWLDKFNGALLPLYVIGLVAAVVWAVAEHGYSNDWLTFQPESTSVAGPGWMFAFTVLMGSWNLMMFTWDYARFSRKNDVRFHANVTFGWVFYTFTLAVNGLIGLFLVQTIPMGGALSETSVVLGIVGLMGLFGVIFVWVSQTRINTANFYVASTNLQSFFARTLRLRLPRTAWAVVAGGIVYAIMLADVFSFILVALRYQGVLAVAWVGVTLVHIGSARPQQLVGSDETEFRPGRVPRFNLGGLGAWFGASVVGIVLLLVGGPLAETWALLITTVLAAGLYAGALKFARRDWYVMSRPYDPRKEVDSIWETRVRCGQCEKSYIAVEMDRDPSDGHRAICAACASESRTFYRAAKAESNTVTSSEVTNRSNLDER